MEHKLIYLARRNPALSAQDFPQAWRDHAQFAGTFGSDFRKYFKGSIQCAKISDVELPASLRNEFDGASLLTMVSREGLLAARYQPGTIDALRQDEERVFAGHVDAWTMNAEEYAVRDGERGACALLSFLQPRAGIDLDRFWNESLRATQALAAIGGTGCVAWNKVVDPAQAYGFRAVIEAWFPDKAAAIAVIADPEAIRALEQGEIADPAAGARLLIRRNVPLSGL